MVLLFVLCFLLLGGCPENEEEGDDRDISAIDVVLILFRLWSESSEASWSLAIQDPGQWRVPRS